MKLAAAIKDVIQCYSVIYNKEKRATTQTALDHFFNRVHRIEYIKDLEPVPSTTGVNEIAAWSTDLSFLGSKITADDDCNHEIRRRLHLGKKAMTNLDSMSKREDITLPIKVHIVKATVFPVVMYGCWTIKKAQH